MIFETRSICFVINGQFFWFDEVDPRATKEATRDTDVGYAGGGIKSNAVCGLRLTFHAIRMQIKPNTE